MWDVEGKSLMSKIQADLEEHDLDAPENVVLALEEIKDANGTDQVLPPALLEAGRRYLDNTKLHESCTTEDAFKQMNLALDQYDVMKISQRGGSSSSQSVPN